MIEKQTYALNCDRCEHKWNWKCCECLGLSDKVYKDVVRLTSLHWFCDHCEASALHPETNVEARLLSMVKKLTEQIDKMQAKLEKKADTNDVQDLQKRTDSMFETSQKQVDSKVDTIVTTLNQNVTTVQEYAEDTLKAHMTEDKEEEIEKNNRKNNIIVHGVKESNKSDPEEMTADDCDTLQTV